MVHRSRQTNPCVFECVTVIQHDDRICCSIAVFIKPDWRDEWYIENERKILWQETGLSLCLSVLTHTPQYCTSILLPLIETMADGVQQIGRQNGADPKLAFSLTDKNINFQHELKPLIGGKHVLLGWWRLWKDSQRFMSTWSLSEVPHVIFACLCSEN